MNSASLCCVDIKSLKNWASTNLSVAPHLRSLLLTEKNELRVDEFLIKIDIWTRLLTEEIAKPFKK